MLEYKTLSADDQGIEQRINAAAREGWEVAFVNVVALGVGGSGAIMVHVVFKREKPPSPNSSPPGV